jgi:hypothetical protein
VSRQGVSLTPLDTVSDKQESPSSVKDESLNTPPTLTVEPSDNAVIDRDTSEWPDPLEFNQPSEADDTPAIDTPTSEERDATEPLSSPFLADAKVEKRPLGAPMPELYSPQQPEEAAASVEAEVTPEPTASESVDQPVEVELPEELRGDLMAIESNISNEQAAVPQDSPAAPVAQTTRPTREPEMPKTVVASAAAAPAVSLPAGGGSIPQQYREEPSTSDQTTGSIYDTASYHQPLEHPAKKKTGWLWVIWVLVLLVLGAGGGALAYLYLLQ